MRTHPPLLAFSLGLAAVGAAAFGFHNVSGVSSDNAPTTAAASVMLAGSASAPALASSPELHGASAPDLPTTRPFVPRPPVAPCGVIEAINLPIDDSDPMIDLPATTPAGCAGALSKIVLEMSYEFDGMLPRPMDVGVWLDGVNLVYAKALVGSDPPSPWYVERDVTDYAAAFRRAGAQARIALDPYAMWDEPSIAMRVTLRIVFYPQGAGAAAPRKPDRVYALGPDFGGVGQTTVDAELDGNTARVRLPRDIERVYVDVLAKSSSRDIATCVPRVVAEAVPDVVRPYSESGGSGQRCLDVPFKEIRVYIDGQIAGVATVAPRYTLHPLPYRVDLSPFAGLLSDGTPHVLRFTDQLDDDPASPILTTASLLVYRDPHSTTVSGAVVRNTLQGTAATPVVTHGLTQTADHVTGPVRTVFNRHFLIEGYIDTARGRMWHRVVQDTYLDNRQQYDVRRPSTFDHRYLQDTALVYKTWRNSYTTLAGQQLRRDYDYLSLPLTVSDLESDLGDLNEYRRQISQGIHRRGEYDRLRVAHYSTRLDERLGSYFHSRYGGGVPEIWESRSASEYGYTDNRGSCYDAVLETLQGTEELIRGAGCPGGVNSVRWFARPDGEPESLGWAGYD
jgi:hypothetical protein